MKSQAGNCWWLDKGLSRVFKGQTGFEFWVLRFRDLGASCFSLRLRVLRFRNYRFVAAMFAHMFIRLIIQNRFHLLLKNFSIWNSLSDVLSAPLFVATISIHLCCLRRWISSRRSSLQRIFRCQIFPCEDWQFGVLVFAVLFAWEMAWDSPIVNIVLQTMKTQLFMSALVIDGNLKLLSVECCLETKMRRDVNYCMTSWRTPSDIYK